MLEHRLAETSEVKTDAERLYDAYQEGARLKREGERIQKELRPEIDELVARGEMVGYSDAFLTYQERTSLSADMDALVADLGPDIALRVASVDSAKLRKLIDAGVIPSDAPYLSTTVTTSLVTKTTPR